MPVVQLPEWPGCAEAPFWFRSCTGFRDCDRAQPSECGALRPLPPSPFEHGQAEAPPTPTLFDSPSAKRLPETDGQETNHTESRESKTKDLPSGLGYVGHARGPRRGVAQCGGRGCQCPATAPRGAS